MKYFLSLSFVMLLLLILSCKKKQPEFNEPMNVGVYEELGYDSRQVMLTFETERSLTCGSAVIQGETMVAGNDISVAISGIKTPPNCTYSPRKVSRSFTIGKLGDGVYNLTVKNGSHTSKGTLTVTQQKLTISLPQTDNITLTGKEIMRIPDGTAWGNVMYARLDQAALADSFTADLEEKGAVSVSLPDGEYHYFTIRSGTLTVAYNGVNLYLYRKDFLYSFAGVSDSLQRLTSDYPFLHPQANFYVRTWDGRNFNYPGPPASTL